MKHSIGKLRKEYIGIDLLETELPNDPMDLFIKWLDDAIRAKVMEANAMTLATVSDIGSPSTRTVLLKQVDERGFTFFTNYESRKAKQLNFKPMASLTFLWKELYRQVTVEGRAYKVERAESEHYFNQRPKGAQIASISSLQSEPLESKEVLDSAFLENKKKFRGKQVPCPANWGGYRLAPDRIEFWQGKKHRLHDRFLYVFAEKQWILTRLYP